MAKLHYLILERFNNYFNRKLIRFESIPDYLQVAQNYYIPMTESNPTKFDFNPNDNITTEIICNGVEFDPDYFLLFDDDGEIVSRWFVMEQKRNREGQWLYFLRRDVLADSYEELKTAPLYVEKGIINDLDSPLLLNNEGVSVNQIKKSEHLLKDSTGIAWLVLYLKKGVLGNSGIGPNHDGLITIDTQQNDDFVYQTLTTPITSWAYYQYVNSDYKIANYDMFTVFYAYFNSLTSQQTNWEFKFWDNAENSSNTSRFSARGNLVTTNANAESILANAYLPQRASLKSQVLSTFGYNSSGSALEVYNGKIIKDSDGKYFQVRVYTVSQGETEYEIKSDNAPALKSSMTTIWNSAFGQSASPNNSCFKVKVNHKSIRIELTPLPTFQTTVDFGAYTGEGTKDSALFDAICLPYGPCWIRKGAGSLSDQANKERSMAIMTSLTTQLTSNYVLDLQLLPYFPARNLSYGPNNIGFPDDPSATALIGKDGNGVITDLIAVCDVSNFSFDLWAQTAHNPVTIIDNSDVPDTFKRKYINDCTMVRLCSPNYNGIFEFNFAKNGGFIKDINVDITLRPYNPYIHANPDFNFLYGQDFNDSRGLICNGDFSLGIINDAWYSYEIQNKNYQAIFDRQIQNLDINNAINRQEAVWGAIAGTAQGATAGGLAGFKAGGAYGAIAGALIGGSISAIGGGLDVENLEKRQAEARSYAVDNYNLQLGNVRALPNSITKTSALTYNNKLFLFYEIYECSEEEKQAYYLKLKYNGMTVGKIDTITPYMSDNNANYFRAKLIRMSNISEDNHYLEAINEELMKGVYI